MLVGEVHKEAQGSIPSMVYVEVRQTTRDPSREGVLSK